MWLVQTSVSDFCLKSGSDQNKIQQNRVESDLCFCFLFGIRLGTALRFKVIGALDLGLPKIGTKMVLCVNFEKEEYFVDLTLQN